MTSSQLYEWELMYARWHLGDSPHERHDVSAAIVAQTVANVHAKKPIALDKFLPQFGSGEPAVHEADALHANMMRLANRTRKGAPRGGDSQAPG